MDNDEIDYCTDDMKRPHALPVAYRPGQESERAKHPKGVPWCPGCRAYVVPVKVAGIASHTTRVVPCLACYLRSGQAERDAVASQALAAANRAKRFHTPKAKKKKRTYARFSCDICRKQFIPQHDTLLCPRCEKARDS